MTELKKSEHELKVIRDIKKEKDRQIEKINMKKGMDLGVIV